MYEVIATGVRGVPQLLGTRKTFEEAEVLVNERIKLASSVMWTKRTETMWDGSSVGLAVVRVEIKKKS